MLTPGEILNKRKVKKFIAHDNDLDIHLNAIMKNKMIRTQDQ